MKASFFFPIFVLCTVISCKSEQEKAFDAAASKNDLGALREFKASYPEGLEEKIQAKYDESFDKLIKDSTAFSLIENAGGILAQYTAAQNYLKENPEGIHINEVNIFLTDNKEKAEKTKSKLDEMRRAFSLYTFGGYTFTGPDESGKGELTKSFKTTGHHQRHHYYVIGYKFDVNTTYKGSYWVDEEGLIHASAKETNNIIYGNWFGNDSFLHDSKIIKELKQEIKREYPDLNHDYLFTLIDRDGTYYMRVNERGGVSDIYSGRMK